MRLLLAGLLALLSVGSAVAEPVPREVLAGAYEDCVRTNPAALKQKNFCWCTASKIGSDMSYQALMTIDGEMKSAKDRGQNLESAARSIPDYWRIIQECRVSAGLGRLP